MRRWFVWLPLSLLTLVALALATALLARAELLETAAKRWLASQGIPDAELTVAAVSVQQIKVTDLRLGASPDAPRAARIAVGYDLSQLLHGRVERVEVDGIDLTVDLAADQPLGPLHALLPAGGDADSAETAFALPDQLPSVALRNAAVTLLDGRETAELTFDGRLGPQRDTLHALLRGELRAPQGHAELVVSARDLRSDPRLRVEATGESDLSRLPWPAAWRIQPTGGRLAFALDGEAALPASGVELGPEALLDRTGYLSLSLQLQEGTLATGDELLAERVSTALDLRAEMQDSTLLLRTMQPLRLSAGRVSAEALTKLGLPAEAAELAAKTQRATVTPWTSGGELAELRRDDNGWNWNGRASAQLDLTDGALRLEGSGAGELAPDLAFRHARFESLEARARQLAYGPHRLGAAQFTGTAEAKPGGLTVDGDLTADGLSLALQAEHLSGLTLQAPIALRHTAAGTRLTLNGPGQVTVPDVPVEAPVELELPLRLTVTDLEATVLEAGLDARATLDPGVLQATLLRRDAEDVPLRATPGPIDVTVRATESLAATAAISDATVEAPSLQVRASQIAADVTYGADIPRAEVTIGRLAHLGDPAYVVPSRLQATVQRRDDGLLLGEGRLQPVGTDVAVPLTATHDPASGAGNLDIEPTAITFAPGGLQPADISPLASGYIEGASGAVTLDGRLAWTADGLTSDGQIDLAGLDLTTPQATVEQLTGTLRLTQLVPPRTAPDQTLTAASVTAGVPLTDVRLRFDLDWPVEGPVLRVALAEGRLAGGTVSLTDEVLQPLAQRNRMTLDVQQLSLEQLVAQLEIEGFEAEGLLDGQIPVSFGRDGFSVDDGRLEATRNGVIRVRLGQTSDALASQGEQVALMVRALRDFQYDVLSMTLRRPASGDLTLGITMQGRNPEVLDGYPFRFNIDLTGDLEPILAALQEGRRLTTELLDRALDAQ